MHYYLATWTDPKGGIVDLAIIYEPSLAAAKEAALIAEGEPYDPDLGFRVVPLALAPPKVLEGFDIPEAMRQAKEQGGYFLISCGATERDCK